MKGYKTVEEYMKNTKEDGFCGLFKKDNKMMYCTLIFPKGFPNEPEIKITNPFCKD